MTSLPRPTSATVPGERLPPGRILRVTLKDIGTVLRDFRKLQQLTQGELALQAATSKSHLCDIEKGRKAMGVDLLGRLLCNLDISWLAFGRAVDAKVAHRVAMEQRLAQRAR